jgi:hypothetical protein
MKDNLQPLQYVLLPTNDASELVSFTANLGKGMLVYEPTCSKRDKDEQNQYLYLISNREIKEGCYVITPFGKVEKVMTSLNTEAFLLVSKKIEATNDPKLIADGVPALPEEVTKIKRANHSDGFLDVPYEVNFISEFCKIYNQKQSANVKGVDVKKLANEFSQVRVNALKGQWDSHIVMHESFNGFCCGFETAQSLQSSSDYSLPSDEEIKKLLKENFKFSNYLSENEEKIVVKTIQEIALIKSPNVASDKKQEIGLWMEMERVPTFLHELIQNKGKDNPDQPKLKDGAITIIFK